MTDNTIFDHSAVYPTGFKLLKPMVHHYPWGIIGNDSLVYRLYSIFMDDPSVSYPNTTERYAELWLGTHVRGPSTVFSPEGNEPLSAHLKRLQLASPREEKDSEYLGFLLKVLAIDSPLSIQVHPDAFMSSQLLATGHLSIVDTTAKAEISIALTEFETLYSLKSLQEIISSAELVPEFGDLVKSSGLGHVLMTDDFSDPDKNYKLTLRILQCILCSDNCNDEILARMTARLEHSESKGFELNPLDKLLLRLHKSFPNDLGIWFGVVMNYVKLEPGQALFIPPNTLHSYLSGTCIECMASSDNVIRGGLTKKHTDCKTVLQCVTRTVNSPDITLNNPTNVDSDGYINVYDVAHEAVNFSVAKILLPPGATVDYAPASADKCAIAITIASNPSVKISALASDRAIPEPHESCETSTVPKLGTALLIYPGTAIRITNGVASTGGAPKKPSSLLLPDVSEWFLMFIAHSNGTVQ